jgi:hypothetical protein
MPTRIVGGFLRQHDIVGTVRLQLGEQVNVRVMVAGVA